jgi:galactitol-specific phosphotransferase system IIB component
MHHPQSPLLTTQNPAIKLEELVYYITNPDIISVYEQTLNTGSKFQTDSILRTQHVRMNALVTTQAQANGMHQESMALVKALADQSLKIEAGTQAIFSIVSAFDSDTDIFMHSKKLVTDFKQVNSKIRLLLQNFMTDIFEESGIDTESFSSKYDELNKLLADDALQGEWALKTMQQDMLQLKAYSKKLSLAPAKEATITAYRPLLPFYTDAVALQQLIARKMQMNPLVSKDLLAASEGVAISTEALIKQFNSWINLLYQYDQQLEALRNQLACIGIIASKVNGDK